MGQLRVERRDLVFEDSRWARTRASGRVRVGAGKRSVAPCVNLVSFFSNGKGRTPGPQPTRSQRPFAGCCRTAISPPTDATFLFLTDSTTAVYVFGKGCLNPYADHYYAQKHYEVVNDNADGATNIIG